MKTIIIVLLVGFGIGLGAGAVLGQLYANLARYDVEITKNRRVHAQGKVFVVNMVKIFPNYSGGKRI